MIRIVAAAAVLAACGGETATVVRDGDAIARFDVELATTAEQRATGLRGADPLCDECGLLIVFPRATEACIDNRGVSFAIDAIYADDGGTITTIEREIPAEDGESRCTPNTAMVLELSGGGAIAVLVGDQLVR